MRARAADIYSELKKGGAFDDLALRYSDGEEAARGGNLGFIRQGDLEPLIERAVEALDPGEFSEPVETQQGFHIIRLDDKKTAQFRPFAEVKDEMTGLVLQQKGLDRYQQWMTDLKNKAYIEVKL
jgi:peptidyl-prolyl cis-trans isomerase SurA